MTDARVAKQVEDVGVVRQRTHRVPLGGHVGEEAQVAEGGELPKMSELVKAMVRDALDAFMNGDIKLAREVLTRDDAVDKIKNNSLKLMVPYMQSNPSKIEAALDLILIARNLERMGDHATNIAEDVIFTYTGVDIRHGLNGPEND